MTLNILMYISALILLLGWVGLLIIGLTYDFDDAEKDTGVIKFFSKANPNNRSKSSAPE